MMTIFFCLLLEGNNASLVNAIEGFITLSFSQNQRRRETKSVLTSNLRKNTLIHHVASKELATKSTENVVSNLNSTPQTAATNLLDKREVLGELFQVLVHLLTDLGGVLEDLLLLDDVEDFLADSAGERVATEGRAVGAGGEDLHEFVVSHDSGDRDDTTAESLGEASDIGADAFVLLSEELTSAAHTGLDFVADEGDVVLGAELAGFSHVSGGRDDDTAFTLDGFEHETSHLLVMLFEGFAKLLLVAEFNDLEAGDDGAEHLAVFFFISDGDGGHTTAVEVTGAGNDEGLVLGDSLFGVAPGADELDGGFDGFSTSVHEERTFVSGGLAEVLGEVTKLVVVEGTRAEGEAVELLLGGGDDPLVTVAVVDGTVTGEEIEVLVAFGVPDVDTLTAGDDDGHGGVVVSTVSFI